MKPSIVILGGGFSGAYCAQALEPEARKGRVDVTLIDRHNYFVFYPLLIEAGTGSLHPRHAVVSIRSFTGKCTFRMAEITGLDVAGRRIHYRIADTEIRDSIRYDHLVLALGSVTRVPPVPGLKEHGFQIKSLADAVALRDHAIQLLERADAVPDQRRALLHWVVAGGNFTGVEVAGEFQEFLRKACRNYPNLDPRDCRVTLVEIADRILPALDADLSDYAVAQMRKRGTEVLLNTSVQALDETGITLHDGRRLDTHTVIWCAGIAPNPLIADLPLPVDERGYMLCDPDLRVRGYRNIWAVGDSAVNINSRGDVYPATAQHATRQGVHLAKNLLRVTSGKEALPFEFRTLGSLTALGCRMGVAKIMGIKLSGFAAWFLWRTVYLLKMPGFGRKAAVAIDWALDLLFKKDFVQLHLFKREKAVEKVTQDV
jgi:NADH dehydrogenase